MRITLVSIGVRRGSSKNSVEDELADEYLARAGRYLQTEGLWLRSTADFWSRVEQNARKKPVRVILMDPEGERRSSAEFSEVIGDLRDRGVQELTFGIGGADGWDGDSRSRADLLLSIGPWILPHGLARIVVAEQIYRALTILTGHPYHSGH